ncbi:DUF1929 domain-containing protein [Chelatococcus sambhunathii]|uniref:DUF1929 domain-containing protein n=1 Tax=Chelatococcus sambhunathii TaxID=363953 RepID=A0ABU1DDY9_9HYPH|nr:galactose oxidase-like domain-containing protein [Chelatococcus sambhunathii]MDR4306333.1 DUF1929 domain-containing protein [Chelatococcus sambhunathii]
MLDPRAFATALAVFCWLASGAAAAEFAPAAAVAQSPDAPGDQGMLLVGRYAGKCVAPAGESAAAGARLVQTTCFDRPAMSWSVVAATGGSRLVNRASGLCAVVVGGSSADEAEVAQVPCAQSGASGLWTMRASDDWVVFASVQSGKCLGVKDAGIEEAGPLVQWTCVDEPSQQWTMSGPGAPSSWGPKIAMPIVPVAASTLRNGKVLTWSSWSRFQFAPDLGKTFTSIFDPETGTATEKLVTNTGHDMFCPGTSLLADGRILVTGGESASKASIYDPKTNKWFATGELNVPRGYNGDTALSTGEALTIGGSWSGGLGGKIGEVWNPATGTWRKLKNVSGDALAADDPLGDSLGDQHMWLFGADDGWAFHAGPSAEMHWVDTAGKGRIVEAGKRGDDTYSQNGNVVMYEAGKLLKVGGAPSYQVAMATSSAYTIDFSRGPWKPVKVAKQKPMAFPRAFANSVVLPNGEVVVVGGQSFPITFTDSHAAMLAEIWSPKTKSFTRLAALSTPRNYHSVAVLLTDGRVLAGGGGLCGDDCDANHPDVEILTPPYLLNADGSYAARPTIVKAPKKATWGETIEVRAEGYASTFALIRLNAATHSLNNDQRRMSVKVLSADGPSFRLKMPKDRGMLLPGDWMLFAMTDKGTPSVAKIIRVQ